ncbi:aldo/keto reductase [Balneolales bacterium ANBcel1]|nr:aldo/keto reductase [Balneolales bacterium ANBcel1]
MKYIDIDSERIPALGFGTFGLSGKQCADAVSDAIAMGYRHIDTAEMYRNERSVGDGIVQSGINRGELFVTTKLWTESLAPDRVRETTEASLRNLQTDYIDLLLIHWPSSAVPLEETLGAMDRLRSEGYVRFLGVSNFPVAWLKRALQTGVPLITNQVEYHVLLSQEKLLSFMREHQLFLTAYSPLAKGSLADHPVLAEIGRKYDKTATQVALRWLVMQDGVAAVPKASDTEKRRKNIDIFDFELDSEDLEQLRLLDKNRRFVDIPGLSPRWD